MTALDSARWPGTSTTLASEVGRLLNSAEVTEMIRVPEATLRYWRHIGIGPRSFKMGPRRVLYRADDVDAWVTAQYADRR
ncbi:helix-turn-helix domain-containing protein [Terrabacter carboxydivorans]|uniref:Helix-turn-helix domain-containing protein n=1 Tax=Terrabacter carboxydivorans TaxID=619730 RepID=A0ABN3MDW9_9MICO